MAQEESMFGPTPLAIQDQLDQQFLQRNSNLDLGSMSARAGLAMGNGINGLLGREDPRVAEAKQVQEAVAELRKSGVDMSNPEEYYKKMAGIFGAKGLTAQAEKAAMKALEYQDKQAERAFKTEDRKAQLQIRSQDLAIKNAQLAKEVAKTSSKPGGAEFLDMLDKLYKNATVESKTKALAVYNETGDADLARKELVGPKDKEPTDNRTKSIEANGRVYVLDKEAAQANPSKTHPTLKDYVEAGAASDRSTRIRVDNGMKLPQDWGALRSKFSDEAKPYLEALRNTGAALAQLNQAGDNPEAATAARASLMRTYRVDSNPSKDDVKRQLNAGGLDDRLLQAAQDFFTGTLTEQKTKNMRAVLAAVAKANQQALAKTKENWSKLPVPAEQKGAIDFITSTAAEDSVVQDIGGAKPPVQYSPETQELLKKYGGAR